MSNSFTFHTDPALSIPITGFNINHLVDGSSDPQDFVFYYGSVVSTQKVQKSSNPGVDPLSIDITNNTPLWSPFTLHSVSETVRSIAKNGFKFSVSSVVLSAKTGAIEPSWPLSVGSSIVDGDVTWVNVGKLHESTEIKLSLSLLGLDTAVAGSPLVLPPTVNGGITSSVPIHLRINDMTAVIGSASELGLVILDELESPI